MTRTVSLSRRRSSSAITSPWKFGCSKPSTMSCTGPTAMKYLRSAFAVSVLPGASLGHHPAGMTPRLCGGVGRPRIDGRPFVAVTRVSRAENLLLLCVELFLRQHALLLELRELLQLLHRSFGKPIVLGGGLHLLELRLRVIPLLGFLAHVVRRAADSGCTEHGTSASEHSILLGAGADRLLS